ncbi:hypothetical protein FISHEDRAFT_34746, partial [Fistulina hepatica ATCC 64428]
LSTVLQILIFLPLTLATLSKSAFLLLSLLLTGHSLVHGTLIYLWGSDALSVLQVPMHPFLLLVCFNAFSAPIHPWLAIATDAWRTALIFLGPLFVLMEGISSLLFAQKLGRAGKRLVGEEEGYQFALLIASSVAYVIAAWWIVFAYPMAAASPLAATLVGIALTGFVFLSLIGFFLRRTNIIESAALAIFIAYNIWLAGFGFDETAGSTFHFSSHMEALINFVTNTLPKPVLVALLYRLMILHLASQILPTIGRSSWEMDEPSDEGRPTSTMTRVLLTYRQTIFVTVYSHLLLLDSSSQIWWRWANIFFTLVTWAVELLVEPDDEVIVKEWKID